MSKEIGSRCWELAVILVWIVSNKTENFGFRCYFYSYSRSNHEYKDPDVICQIECCSHFSGVDGAFDFTFPILQFCVQLQNCSKPYSCLVNFFTSYNPPSTSDCIFTSSKTHFFVPLRTNLICKLLNKKWNISSYYLKAFKFKCVLSRIFLKTQHKCFNLKNFIKSMLLLLFHSRLAMLLFSLLRRALFSSFSALNQRRETHELCVFKVFHLSIVV